MSLPDAAPSQAASAVKTTFTQTVVPAGTVKFWAAPCTSTNTRELLLLKSLTVVTVLLIAGPHWVTFRAAWAAGIGTKIVAAAITTAVATTAKRGPRRYRVLRVDSMIAPVLRAFPSGIR